MEKPSGGNGEVIDVGVDENEMATREVMRIKVKLDITKPLMRGITIITDDDEEEVEHKELLEEADELQKNKKEKERVVSFKYEFLPDFCNACGVICHQDMNCTNPLKARKGDYGRWRKAEIFKQNSSDEEKGRSSNDTTRFWIDKGGGSRGSKQCSDAMSWKKSSTCQEGGFGVRACDENSYDLSVYI